MFVIDIVVSVVSTERHATFSEEFQEPVRLELTPAPQSVPGELEHALAALWERICRFQVPVPGFAAASGSTGSAFAGVPGAPQLDATAAFFAGAPGSPG